MHSNPEETINSYDIDVMCKSKATHLEHLGGGGLKLSEKQDLVRCAWFESPMRQ